MDNNNLNMNNNNFGADVPNGAKEHKENIVADNSAQAQPQVNNSVPIPPAFSMPQWNNQAPVNTVPVPPMPQWVNQVPAPPMPQWVNQVPAPPVPPMPHWIDQAPVNTVPTPPINSSQTDTYNINNANNTNNNQALPMNESTANQQQNPFMYQTPYQQDYNQAMPRIEYVPYIPGTELPKGVTPQFINGGWYYPVTVDGKKSRKKMKTSVKVFMGVMAGIAVASIALLVGWLSTFENSGGNVFEGIFGNESSKSDSAEDKKTEIGLLANPNGPEIKLDSNNTEDGSTEKAYEVLSESVVSIAVYSSDKNPSTGLPISEGTGIIISADGYIATNSHVILDDIGSNVWVTTKSGSLYHVGVVGCDERTDLAVLLYKDAKDWKYASFANSDELKVGQDVVAIGSPGGSNYSSSLTRGIISALDRTLSGSAVTYIQTDAAINPGNSGGPLANMNGQVVGINTIKVVDTQFEGMGFAIPSTKIKEVVDEIIKNGYVTGRARLGVMVTEFSNSMAKYYNAEPGVRIAEINDESPIKDSKAKEGDIITAIDGKPVTSLMSLYEVLDSYKEGDTVELSIYRINKKDNEKHEEFKVKVKLLGD